MVEVLRMRKCKFGYCTVNCKSPKRCADFKVSIGCSLAITEEEYQKRISGSNIVSVNFNNK
jgi:hypothetical protein